MLRSRKFWVPVMVGIAVTGVATLFAVTGVLAGGAHAKPGATIPSLGSLLFPFTGLFERATSVTGFAALVIVFLFQFPVYGSVAGYGNYNGKLKPYLLVLFVIHIVVYLTATYLINP